MDRREFIKGMGVAGGLATGLAAAGGAGTAAAAHHEGGHGGGTQARKAMRGLLDTIRQIEDTMLTAERGFDDPAELAEAERAIAHILQTGLDFWLEGNPERPVFRQYVTPTRKLLGCNPDSIYYFAPIRDDRRYRISGNVGAATFTSFTIEQGSHDGHAARGSIAAISDEDMKIDKDGSFEVIVSRDDPGGGKNWLRLADGASQVTTRHYHEARNSVATLPAARAVPIQIEALDPPALPSYRADDDVAAHLTWVTNFVKEHAAMTFRKTTPEMAKQLGWVSIEPNEFTKPGQWGGGESAYGNTHAWYASAPFRLADDEALVMTGRFPDCRFANVVLWNSFMQSFDYANRQISLNRKQVHYEKDGSFRIVIAHKDPGTPNWLDTEGRNHGTVYWRWIFPTSAPGQVKSKVVKHSKLG